MKTTRTTFSYCFLLIQICSIIACSKGGSGGGSNTPPQTKKLTLVTHEVQRVSINGYECTGDITDYGTILPITERGVCWATHTNPSKSDNFYASTNLLIDFLFPALNAKETYYVRAYAVNSQGVTFGNEVTFTTPLELGFLYQGGVIFSYDSSRTHGLVAAPIDQGSAVLWAPGNLFATSTYTTNTSNGSSNTDQIINTYGNSDRYAAKLCRDYDGGGYHDWYLPAIDELVLLSSRQNLVGGFPAPDQFTQFFYWSSTEYDYFRAWDTELNTSLVNNFNDQKNSLYYVRAIRAF